MGWLGDAQEHTVMKSGGEKTSHFVVILVPSSEPLADEGHHRHRHADLFAPAPAVSRRQIMGRVTKLQVQWEKLQGMLIPDDCIEGVLVKFEPFLDRFQVQYGQSRDLACRASGGLAAARIHRLVCMASGQGIKGDLWMA
jgi:hypothetical protein